MHVMSDQTLTRKNELKFWCVTNHSGQSRVYTGVTCATRAVLAKWLPGLKSAEISPLFSCVYSSKVSDIFEEGRFFQVTS